MNNDPASSSRLRKGGLTRSLTTTAACAAALLTANAAIFYTANVNGTVDQTPGSDQTANVFIVPGYGLQLYTYFDTKSGRQGSGVLTISSMIVREPNTYSLWQLGAGVPVDGSLSPVVGGGGIANPTFYSGWSTRGDSGYFAFSLNPSGSLPLYGWGELIRSATGTDTITFTRYAYDDSGAAIFTGDTGGAVPEPEDYAVVAGPACWLWRGIGVGDPALPTPGRRSTGEGERRPRSDACGSESAWAVSRCRLLGTTTRTRDGTSLLFSLTPPSPPGRGGRCSPRSGQRTRAMNGAGHPAFPSPGGRGQGEGERRPRSDARGSESAWAASRCRLLGPTAHARDGTSLLFSLTPPSPAGRGAGQSAFRPKDAGDERGRVRRIRLQRSLVVRRATDA